MATNLRLDYAQASEEAKKVMDNAAEIETILNNLNADVNADVGNTSVWAGTSATEFKNAWNQCSDNFVEFVNHIKAIQSKIEITAQEVASFDQK